MAERLKLVLRTIGGREFRDSVFLLDAVGSDGKKKESFNFFYIGKLVNEFLDIGLYEKARISDREFLMGVSDNYDMEFDEASKSYSLVRKK